MIALIAGGKVSMLRDSHPSNRIIAMPSDTIRALSQRIKRLRQERGWSQAELAKRLSVHQKQISGYERAVHSPSTEVLIRMAQEFNCSLDFLAFDDRSDTSALPIADRELLEKIKEIEQLPEQDRATIKAVLDTFLLKRRFQNLATG
jgi:transcriptional regulator with XRE-family HTH domain